MPHYDPLFEPRLTHKVLLIGDFNIQIDDVADSGASKFLDILQSFDLRQHVSCHTLDVIITRMNDDLLFSTSVTTYQLSDHLFVECIKSISKSTLSRKEVTYRKVKEIYLKEFKQDIANRMYVPPVIVTLALLQHVTIQH